MLVRMMPLCSAVEPSHKQSWHEQTATCHVYSTHQERPCRGRVEAHGTVRYSTEAVTMMSNHDGGYE